LGGGLLFRRQPDVRSQGNADASFVTCILKRNAEFDRLVTIATHHHEAGQLAEAEIAYHAALEISPGHTFVVRRSDDCEEPEPLLGYSSTKEWRC
jgi:hypothetical protein